MAEQNEAHRRTSAGYFTGLRVAGVRCFGPEQHLSLADRDRPAKWTIVLGENGVGKTTLLQCLWAMAPPVRLSIATDTDGETLRLAAMALERLVTSSQDDGEYAAMARALLRQVAPWRTSWNGPTNVLLEELRRDAHGGHELRIPA